MRIAPSSAPTVPAPSVGVADPIAWMHVEERDSRGTEGEGRWRTQSIELEPWIKSLATLIDGRMSYPGEAGTPIFWYESSESNLRSGVDPTTALTQAQRGVADLTAAVERAAVDLEPFLVERNGRHPRDPDAFEVWMRRESGAQARYIVPLAKAPQSVLDARAAANAFAAVMRRNYDRLDPL